MMEKILSRSVRLVFAGGFVLGSQVVGAQQIQKVEVTGTRIPSINVEGPSPITVVSAKDIKVDGARNVEDILNNLPQVFADQGGAVSNGATGTSTVSLRGLGSDRTLVLVNGRRLPQGSVNSSAADLNEIPASLIKRVDVLTGGAGAVYGAGAVAGVVNFILKDNFEGVEFQLNTSGNNHSKESDIRSVVTGRGFPVPGSVGYDGKTQDASVLIGGNFNEGKGNATAFFSYKKIDPLLQRDRDFSACTLGSTDTSFNCSGSSTNATGRIKNNTTGVSYTNADSNGTARRYSAGTDAYNFGPLNYFQRPSETYNFNAQAHYDVDSWIRIYNEFNYHNNSTDAQIAPGGVFYGQTATVGFDNPLLSSSWRTALGLVKPGDTTDITVGRRNIEGGGRVTSITDASFREVLGAKGDLGKWTYNVFGQVARVNHEESNNNYFSTVKVANALDVVVGANGQAVCRSVINGSDPNCVPYNIFRNGGVTPAQLNYLSTLGIITGYVEQVVVGATIGSDLGAYGIKLPTATNGIGVSFGAERRYEKKVYTPDNENQTGDLSGAGGVISPLSGSYSVKEVFGEIKVPLVEKRPFIESLEVSGSYRYSDYSTNKKTNTFGIGVDWSPVKELTFRGSYQQAVRAATINDLFTAQSVGLSGPNDDPCASSGPGVAPAATAAQCARSGVTAAQYGKIDNNSSNQYQNLGGGNPLVNPEKAKTYTYGFVVQPVKNLSITVDGFNIKVDDTIGSVDPTIALNQCLQTGNPTFCNLIHRDATGSLWLSNQGYVVTALTNIGKLKTSGVDLAAAYSTKIGSWGALNFTMNGTYLSKLETEPVPGLGSYNCKGFFGATCGTPNPEWRHKFRTTWSTPWNVDVAGTWRHFASVKNDTLSDSPLLNSGGPANAIEQKIDSRDYFDLYASWTVIKGISISGGVNNVFDKNPPIVSSNATTGVGTFNGNTYPQVYDTYGRKLFVNLTAKF
jgi:outer membrane receptor protein involved in Fe transport